MKLIYPALAILLFSCTSPEKAETTKEPAQNTSIVQDSVEVIENDWEDEETIILKNKEKLNQLMEEKNFEFICTDNCKSGAASHEDVLNHKNKAYFKFEKVVSDSSVYIQYRFVQSCCMEFGGDYNIENGTIKLVHYQINESACDCRCVYEYAFNIQNHEYDDYVITLNGVVME